MYARDTKLKILEVPVVGKKIGFDLIKFDWVKPYGDGSIPDFIFEVQRFFENTSTYGEKVTLTFSNDADGIILYNENLQHGSLFKLPRYAPERGYQKLLSTKSGRDERGYYDDFSYSDNYIFRVRSEIDSEGNVNGLYGKMYGPLVVAGIMKDKPKLVFKYYLNPDGTKNLEFDPEYNLFGELPPLEQVRIK